MGLVSQKLDLRDDRGVVLATVEPEHRREGLWQDRKKPWRSWSSWRFLSVVPVLGLGVYVMWSRGWSPQPIPWLVVAFGVGSFGPRVSTRGSVRRLCSNAKRLAWGPIAWLSAYRHCGACGYSLAEVEAGEDGCATCPECGAAWHRDRWTMAGQDPRENSELVGLLGGARWGRQSEANAFVLDDRGVPFKAPGGAYPKWVSARETDGLARERVRRGLNAAGNRWLVVAACVWVPVWAGLVGLIVWQSQPLPREWWSQVFLLTALFGLLGLLMLYLVRRFSISDSVIRKVSLGEGRCPCCGGAMNGDAEFDGCVACRRCSRAWRVEAKA
ncbi:MAG: hypothetical protein HEQ23_02320 [Tepidisphaera sp.]